jgi:Ragulator complex protein LAMTOR5
MSRAQSSVLADAGDNRKESGILCNDPNGLCIASEGSLGGGGGKHEDWGVYTNMVKLASQLTGADSQSAPLITIETDQAAILVKSYEGHTVALRVPSSSSGNSDGKGMSMPGPNADVSSALIAGKEIDPGAS